MSRTWEITIQYRYEIPANNGQLVLGRPLQYTDVVEAESKLDAASVAYSLMCEMKTHKAETQFLRTLRCSEVVFDPIVTPKKLEK